MWGLISVEAPSAMQFLKSPINCIPPPHQQCNFCRTARGASDSDSPYKGLFDLLEVAQEGPLSPWQPYSDLATSLTMFLALEKQVPPRPLMPSTTLLIRFLSTGGENLSSFLLPSFISTRDDGDRKPPLSSLTMTRPRRIEEEKSRIGKASKK